MKIKQTLLASVILLLMALAGLAQANSPPGQLVPAFEPRATLHPPEETRSSLENNSTQSAAPKSAPSHIGGWAAGVLDHGKGLGLGLLVGGAVAVGLFVVVGVVVTGPVLGVIAVGALAAGGIYGLITGAARFNVVDAAVQSLIGGVSAGIGFGLGAGGFLAGRTLTAARAGLGVLTGGFANLGTYLVQTPHPSLHGAGTAFGWGAATAGVFMGLGALASKVRGPLGAVINGWKSRGAVAATVESELAPAGPAVVESSPAALQRIQQSAAGATANNNTASTAARMGTYRELRTAKVRDGHHIIQGAAVRDIPGYSRDAAPAIHLQGPPTDRSSAHYLATQAQREAGGGTYAAERDIAARSLHAAGLSQAQIKQALKMADDYFHGLGVTDQTPLRIPGDRAN